MKYLALIMLLAATVSVAGESTIRLEVSATVPPRPCVYPDSCGDLASQSVPAAETRVVVSQETVSYVGSPPTVEKQDDLLVVRF